LANFKIRITGILIFRNCLAANPGIVLLSPVEDLMNAMDRQGWATMQGWVNPADSNRLKTECEASWEKGDFRRAGVGRGQGMEIREEIRRDQVMWLDPGSLSAEQSIYLATLETLRLAMNRRFFLGLFEFEGHFAIYPEGAFYKAHLDRHSGTGDRVVTVILYLNPDWQPGDGGELKLWTTSGEREGAFTLIEPRMGTLVCFMAGDFWHEVLPANKTRMSITGWFRQR
jgi:SM-20-related protein